MATQTITYTAWDTGADAPKTGDVGNHAIYVIADGVKAAADNSPAEVDAANCPGEYSLVLSAAELAAKALTVCGKSSTGNVVIVPVKLMSWQALLDEADAIDGKTIRQALRYQAAFAAGKVSGARTGTETFKGLDGATDRLQFTTDNQGNRTGVAYDP